MKQLKKWSIQISRTRIIHHIHLCFNRQRLEGCWNEAGLVVVTVQFGWSKTHYKLTFDPPPRETSPTSKTCAFMQIMAKRERGSFQFCACFYFNKCQTFRCIVFYSVYEFIAKPTHTRVGMQEISSILLRIVLCWTDVFDRNAVILYWNFNLNEK